MGITTSQQGQQGPRVITMGARRFCMPHQAVTHRDPTKLQGAQGQLNGQRVTAAPEVGNKLTQGDGGQGTVTFR